MQPLSLLKCLGKALVRHMGNAAGVDAAGDMLAAVGEDVWKDWQRAKNDQERRAELQAILEMKAEDFRREVESVVREGAQGAPGEVRQRLSNCLQEVPTRLRRALQWPAGTVDQTLHLTLPLSNSGDLVALLSGQSPAAALPMPIDQLPAWETVSRPPAHVKLTVLNGPLQGREVILAERSTCIIGRTKDCHLRLPKDPAHLRISRHHCLLEINLPDMRIRDLGSLHGTSVNGQEIGRRPKGTVQRSQTLSPEYDLKDEDVIRLGKSEGISVHVRVVAPTCCATCGTVLPEDQKANFEVTLGIYQCAVCQAKIATPWVPPGVGSMTCSRCGHPAAGQPGTTRQGDFLCQACRQVPDSIVEQLLTWARAGEPNLAALTGYTLAGKLGQGGMGAVYRGRSVGQGPDVAIKVMLPRVAASPEATRRFLVEIAGTRLLQHPHVVRLWGAGASRGILFMVLEYCEGRSVTHLMKERGGTLPLDEAVAITRQALDGLEYAHNVLGPGKGVVHRDLKPDNIFLSGAGSGRLAKVGDYGLAKAFDESGLTGGTMTGDRAGSPHFMSRPQVCHFKDAGPEVDVWAMAASLYCMLTGCTPREFPKESDPWLQILETDPIPIRQRNPQVPRKLAAVIDRALQEEPAIPFQTATALRAALESAL